MKFIALLLFSVHFQAQAATGRWFDRVVVIVLENESVRDVLDEPYFRSLTAKGALFENYASLIHPSYPNYIAMVAGAMLVAGDTPRVLDVKHLGDLLEEKSLDWKIYAENYPGNCYLRNETPDRLYVRRHVPFLSFKNVISDANRCAKIIDNSTFMNDWNENKLPEFSLYIPNQNNNGHDSSLAYSAKWLEGFFEPLLNSPQIQRNLVVITYDEAAIFGAKKIFTMAFGAGVKPGSTIAPKTSHYGLLRTVEDNFDLGTLGRKDQLASSFPLW